MLAFRLYLAAVFAGVGVYTFIVGMDHGWNLIPVFFSDIAAMAWPGQFNLDFMTFLGLSGLWVAWRHHFTPGGLALGGLFFVGGIMVLAPYLLYASYQADGDMKRVMLGEKRAKS